MALKYSVALKQAEFAAQLLAAAGFDLSVLAESGDAKALLTAINAKVAAVKPSESDQALAEAAQENESLTRQLLAKTAAVAGIEKAISAAGLKLSTLSDTPKAEDIAARETALTDAIKARASVLAQEQLAAAGHPPVADPVIDTSKPSPATKSGLTGSARVRAAFAAQRN